MIGRINEFQTTIASAVEEQTATTQDMNHSVGQAASGSGGIARQIGRVVESVRGSALAAGEVRASADELRRLSGELNEALAGFRY